MRSADHLGLLRGGPRDLPARQRTLRGAIEYIVARRNAYGRVAVLLGAPTARLEGHLTEYLCALLGGGDSYRGRDISTVHEGMRICDDEFDRFLGHLSDSFAAGVISRTTIWLVERKMRACVPGQILAVAILCGCGPAAPGGPERKVIVLGIDAMDPAFLERHWDELPNLERLRLQGEFKRLATTVPPQSPVAWSTFTTGMNPGGHGIYDFVHRDPLTLAPFSSLATIDPPKRTLRIGPYVLPAYMFAAIPAVLAAWAYSTWIGKRIFVPVPQDMLEATEEAKAAVERLLTPQAGDD